MTRFNLMTLIRTILMDKNIRYIIMDYQYVGDLKINFGKYKGLSFFEIKDRDLAYCRWLLKNTTLTHDKKHYLKFWVSGFYKLEDDELNQNIVKTVRQTAK